MPRTDRALGRARLAAERLEDRVNPVWFTGGDWGWTGSNGMTVSFGEINGDGQIDLAVGTASGIEIYTNDGTGDFTFLNNITGTGFPEQMELVDLNRRWVRGHSDRPVVRAVGGRRPQQRRWNVRRANPQADRGECPGRGRGRFQR